MALFGFLDSISETKRKIVKVKDDISFWGLPYYTRMKTEEYIENKKDEIADRIEIASIKDPVKEGKKRGREKAANEYGKAYQNVKDEYDSLKQILTNKKEQLKLKSESLINKLEKLEEKRYALEKDLINKTDTLENNNFFNYSLFGNLANSTLGVVRPMPKFDWNSGYVHKKYLLSKAEQESYEKEKATFVQKINILKNELRRLKEKSEGEIHDILEMIENIISDIANEEMRIAELKILLCGD